LSAEDSNRCCTANNARVAEWQTRQT
jgi:hypothetical protein